MHVAPAFGHHAARVGTVAEVLARQNDRLQFPAVAGSYWLVSAKGTDLAGGLWIRLEVQDGLRKSEMVINNERIRRGYRGFVGRM